MNPIRRWLTERRDRQRRVREDLSLAENQELIGEHVPELRGMGFIEGGAYVLREIDAFKSRHGQIAALGYVERLTGVQDQWRAEGRVMPWWLNLAVLRQYEADWIAASDSDDSVIQP